MIGTCCGLSGQCTDTADFNSWDEPGYGSNWQILSDHVVREVNEILPLAPTFFVSDEPVINVRFSFDLVSRNGADNDFVGFVMGYRHPAYPGSDQYQFILFDWKAEKESAFSHFADEGFRLGEFHGSIPESSLARYFWGHNGLTGNQLYTPIVHSFGESNGWVTGKNYHFEVTYTTLSIQVDLDGTCIFYVDRCNEPGKIGFYTFSQHDVEFSNLILQPTAGVFVPTRQICQGDSVRFDLEIPECPGINQLLESWTWDFGDGASAKDLISGYHTYNEPGNFNLVLVATFPHGCHDTVVTEILVQPALSVDLGPDTIIPVNASLVLTAGPDNGYYGYLWSDGSVLNRLYLNEIRKDTTISVYVTYGLCSDYDELLITVDTDLPPPFEVFIPNSFTPNGDGRNDVFQPVFSNEIPGIYSLMVYDRWGRQIFITKDPGTGWDGMIDGKAGPESVYVYIVRSGDAVKKGNILLLR